MRKITLQPLIVWPAQAAASTVNGLDKYFFLSENIKEIVVTLDIVLADRTNADEKYDFFVTTFQKLASGTFARWDLAHFPQLAGVGPIRYTTVIKSTPPEPLTVTTAGPGVPVVMSATMQTIADAANEGRGTLAAGLVRHGSIGEGLNWTLITLGTTPGPITFEIGAILKE